ncbi:MAG: selenocysteine-specific translation elongation factor [Porticoccaceae bacterium]|nr:selenocysteine-specific translation elongation factor [Porticoccaceae bacterium]
MIVATAGHVDHGKTTLIKQITGIDTDTLEEEKRRGVSINLGYAFLHENSESIGFIDVPGHHRFINTMISGVSSIDMALVVVAASEGLKPQTTEHFEILRLLGIKKYAIILTHIDRVDLSHRESIASQIQGLVGDDAPVFPVNNKSGDGISQLKNYLLNEAMAQDSKSEQGHFRLSIDRKFLLNGIGLVTTGTVISGRISEGDSLILLPHRKDVRVRAIHAQNRKSSIGQIGERCALQISGIEKKDISRGDWLSACAQTPSTNRINVRLEISRHLSFTLKHLCPIKLFIGAKLISAKLYLLERKKDGNFLKAATSVFAQIIIDGQISCCSGDRFIIRDDSELVTLGGGSVIDPFAEYSPKFDDDDRNYLLALEMPTILQKLERLVVDQKCLVNLSEFEVAQNLREEDLDDLLGVKSMQDKATTFQNGNQTYILSKERWKISQQSVLVFLRKWHENNPSLSGLEMDQILAEASPIIDEVIFPNLIQDLIDTGSLSHRDGKFSIKGIEPVVPAVDLVNWEMIKEAIARYHQQIPTLANIKDELSLDSSVLQRALKIAVKDRQAFMIGESRFLLPDTLSFFAEKIKTFSREKSSFSVVEVKNLLSLGRNSCIDLLEYFDLIGFTKRFGAERIIIDEQAIKNILKKSN